MTWHGIIPPVVTPMRADESLDLDGLAALVDRFLAAGVHGLFVLGTTGEFYALTPAEKQAVMARAAAQVAGRVPLVAGTGGITTREVLELNRVAEREGVDAVAVITPYFLSPTQAELFDHYRRIAEHTALPVLLYTNPPMCGGVRLEVETVARLAELPNIVGIKDSAGDLTQLIETIRATPSDFAVFQGRDTLIAAALEQGAAGAVPGTANIAPHWPIAIYDAHRRGDPAAARQAQARFSPLRLALAVGTAPGAIKAAMNLAGVPVGPSRLPIAPLRPEQIRKIQDVLAAVLPRDASA